MSIHCAYEIETTEAIYKQIISINIRNLESFMKTL